MTDPISSLSSVAFTAPRRPSLAEAPVQPPVDAPLHSSDSISLQGGPVVTVQQPALENSPAPAAPSAAVSAPKAPAAPNVLVQLEPLSGCSTPDAFDEVQTKLTSFENGYTQTHMRRTAEYAGGLAAALEGTALALTPQENRALSSAAEVYDAGKLAVDEKYWNDARGPRDMPPEEWKTMWNEMCRHVDVSTEKSRQAGKAGDPEVEFAMGALNSKVAGGDDDVRSIIRHHHEKLDGTGYPDKLKGDEIPKGAQILGICDMYEALRSPRSFRAPKDYEAARGIIEGDATNGKLNAEMVRVFFETVVPQDDRPNA